VQDTELSYTPRGTAVCKFTVASNRFYKQEEEMEKEGNFIRLIGPDSGLILDRPCTRL
jgi:single-stranded DNA-binding protein